MYGNNPYYGQQRFQPMSMPQQPMNQQFIQPQPIQPITTPTALLGKIVDNVDVVKATDIPLDGSTSYFPLADGSAIVTKKLQTDGTSKTIIYKPTEEEKIEAPKYATIEDIEKEISKLDLNDLEDLKDEIKEIKKELKEIKKRKED